MLESNHSYFRKRKSFLMEIIKTRFPLQIFSREDGWANKGAVHSLRTSYVKMCCAQCCQGEAAD